MTKEIGGTLYLTGEDAREFMYKMLHPDDEAMRRRDAFLAECEKIKITRKDGEVILEADFLDDEAIKKALTIQN